MRNIFNIAFFAICSFLLLTSNAQASAIADTPCDAQYYDSLSARAWLEAQREITQNQNLILKPDSVFEYTCFDRLVGELSTHAENMLSETAAFGEPLDDTSMDLALQRLVGDSLVNYINANFGSKTTGIAYNMLAGHIAATGIGHTMQSLVNPGAYSCDIMDKVWTAAKCINFAHNSETGGFFTFGEYADPASLDKRNLPPSAICTPLVTAWSSNLTNALTSGPWSNDDVQTYFGQTNAPDCTDAACRCRDADNNFSVPIPTGIKVKRAGYDTNEYDEKICLQPGCRYHPGGSDDLNSNVSSAPEGCYGR